MNKDYKWLNERLFDFFEVVEQNIADEAEAREGYYRLIDAGEGILKKEEIQLIEEIISEELKHSEILKDIIQNRTGIEPERIKSF